MSVEVSGEWAKVEIPTEDGRLCYLHFERRHPGYWSLHISDELLKQSPQALHAAIGLALLELAHIDGSDDASQG